MRPELPKKGRRVCLPKTKELIMAMDNLPGDERKSPTDQPGLTAGNQAQPSPGLLNAGSKLNGYQESRAAIPEEAPAVPNQPETNQAEVKQPADQPDSLWWKDFVEYWPSDGTDEASAAPEAHGQRMAGPDSAGGPDGPATHQEPPLAPKGYSYTTPRQRETNRLNAKFSTGPKTEAGKSRSAQNGVRHGAWADNVDYIPWGPFREDPATVLRLETSLVEHLGLGVPVLEEAARSIARAMKAEGRVDKWAGALLADRANVDTTHPDLKGPLPFPRNPFFDHAYIALARATSDERYLVDAPMCEVVPEYPHVSWELVHFQVQTALGGRNQDPDDDEYVSRPEREWCEMTQALLKAHFSSPVEANHWAHEFLVRKGIAGLEAQARVLAAEQCLKAMEAIVSRPSSRAIARVAGSIRAYEALLRIHNQLPQTEEEV
jgi:hypothetical protein